MIDKEQITTICNEALENTDRFVVEVKVRQGNDIIVFIDSDTSVSIDDCAELSRHIESRLDRDVEDFELSVSSAGLDRPLRLPRQFQKHLGKEVSVKLAASSKKIVGTLTGFDESGIVIRERANKRKKTEAAETRYELIETTEIKPEISF